MSDLLRVAEKMDTRNITHQNNEDIIDDVSKLVTITGMLVDTYKDFILEVYVTPMYIFQHKTSDIKNISFKIVYDASYEGDINATKSGCNELLKVLVSDEFEGIDKIGNTEFNTHIAWKEQTFLLYSVFNKFTVEDLSDGEYVALYDIISTLDCAVSIPVSYKFSKVKCIYIHCRDNNVSFSFENKFTQYCKDKGIVAVNAITGKSKGKVQLIYSLLFGLKPIQYDVPYLYIDGKSFNIERLNTLGFNTTENKMEDNYYG